MASLEGRARRASDAARGSRPLTVVASPPLNIVDFATRLLGQVLYPRQGTVLKILSADLRSMTAYDREVIAEWATGFQAKHDDGGSRWEGGFGVPPDTMARIEKLASAGLPWFTSVVLVLGRRASKGFIVRTLLAWRVWNFVTLGDPHRRYGIDDLKPLQLLVFSTKMDQAKRDQFGDVHALLTTAACFEPMLGRSTREMVSILTPRQIAAGARPGQDDGLIVVRAAESTSTAARGAAVPMLVLDEVAHLSGAGSTSDAATIYDSAMPAVAQFGDEGLVVLSSSPAEKTGPQYTGYQQALEINPATGEAAYPKSIVLQGPSWCLYQDWQDAPKIEMWPGGPSYSPLTRAILDEGDDEVKRLRQSNPETYAVEYEGQFRAARNAYLPLPDVVRIFEPFDGRTLETQTTGQLGRTYMAHGDPSVSGANFGFAIGHGELHDGHLHVVFDVVTGWEPRNFEGARIDYEYVEDELVKYAVDFGLSSLTFDQYNSAQVIQRLDRRIKDLRLPKPCSVSEITATAERNWHVAEVFKTAAGMGIIHAPWNELARLELEYLQRNHKRIEPAATGEVRTKDIADAMFAVAHAVIADNGPTWFADLGALKPSGSQPGGLPSSKIGHDEAVFKSLGPIRGRAATPYAPRGSRRPGRRRYGR